MVFQLRGERDFEGRSRGPIQSIPITFGCAPVQIGEIPKLELPLSKTTLCLVEA
jgi:hypothetical protein